MMMLPFHSIPIDEVFSVRSALFEQWAKTMTLRGGIREKRCLVTSADKLSTYYCTKEESWTESAFGMKQGRSHGEQRVTQNTDLLLSLPIRLATVSRQTLFHLISLPLYQ